MLQFIVQDQIVHPELQIRRQRRLEPDDLEDDWYTQDQAGGTEETNLFGRNDPNRIDWDLLPEDEPLDSPFAGLSAEEILGLGFEREMAQIGIYNLLFDPASSYLTLCNTQTQARSQTEIFTSSIHSTIA